MAYVLKKGINSHPDLDIYSNAYYILSFITQGVIFEFINILSMLIDPYKRGLMIDQDSADVQRIVTVSDLFDAICFMFEVLYSPLLNNTYSK